MLNNQYYRAAYEFHQKWSPYPVTLDDWSKAAGDMCKIRNEGDNDMLVMDLLVPVYRDLEREWRSARERGEIGDEGI